MAILSKKVSSPWLPSPVADRTDAEETTMLKRGAKTAVAE